MTDILPTKTILYIPALYLVISKFVFTSRMFEYTMLFLYKAYVLYYYIICHMIRLIKINLCLIVWPVQIIFYFKIRT